MTEEIKEYMSLFRRAERASSIARQYAKDCEAYYYDDVEDTYTQYTRSQVDQITKYTTPVSTKFCFAIVENMLAYLTGTKPYPKIISAEASVSNEAEIFEKLFKATWYESKGTDKITYIQRDALTTGSGFAMVRKSNSFKESTTNVIIEYIPQKHVLVDPETRDWTFEDAEYIIYWNIDRRSRLESKYGITIPKDMVDEEFFFGMDTDMANDYMANIDFLDDKTDYLLEWTLFQKEIKDVFVCSNQYTGLRDLIVTKRPESINIPHPEKAVLKAKLLMLEQEVTRLETMPSEESEREVVRQEIEQIQQAMEFIAKEMQKLPEVIAAYRVITTDGRTQIATEVNRNKITRVKETLLVGTKKIYQAIRETSKYPIRHLPFIWANNPNKRYGIIHFIKDINDMMNKYLQEIMYDVSTNAHRKGFLWEGTVIEPDQFENDFSSPNAFVTLRPNPILGDKSTPILIEPSPLSGTLQHMLAYFKDLIEYITGIWGVLQGNPQGAPSTASGIQTLQSFGTQRIKTYARTLENFLSDLAEVTINYLQAYCPRNKIIKYFDENGDGQEIVLTEVTLDSQFKVRVDVITNLPTTRLQNAETLAYIAQTFRDDRMKALAMEYYLKVQDIPEAREVAEKFNVIDQLQQQLQALQQEVEELHSQKKLLEHNMAQKEISYNVEMEKVKAKSSIETERQKELAKVSETETSETEEDLSLLF